MAARVDLIMIDCRVNPVGNTHIESLKWPNGDRPYPLVGFQQFDTIAPIRQLQMVQETLERVTVRFVTEQPLTLEQKSALAEIVQDALAYPFELEIIDQREYFPRQAGGKFEEFVSRVT